MKRIILLLFGGTVLFSSFDDVQAQRTSPCLLVCQPPEALDPEKCSCEKPSRSKPKHCTLVCLEPDETLDVEQCRCVKR